MGFIKFIASRYFWINLAIAIALLFLALKFTLGSLKDFTHHGESVEVPDLLNLTLPEVEEKLKKSKLEFVVIDSTFLLKKKPNIVLDQDPDPNSKVKEGRKIYLTVTRRVPTPVAMPNVKDQNIALAQRALENLGLNVAITYRPAQGKHKVIEQRYAGKEILPGKEIPKGSKIELVVADGIGETKGEVPNLIGLTANEAKAALIMLSFEVGYVGWDPSVTDSTTAVVYKQVPDYDPAAPIEINYGETVDIFLTQKLPLFLEQHSADPTDNEEEE